MGILTTLAPGLIARRAEARARQARAEAVTMAATRQVELLQRYDAARQGGRMSGWRRPHTSATTEIQPALPFLRAAGRDLVRNSPHAARAVRVLTSHIAGTGVRPRAVVEDGSDELERAARDAWERFVETCDPSGQLDFYGQQRLLARAVVESGEALRVWRPVDGGGELRWQCEVVEADMLDHQRNETRPDGSRIIQGVEFDADGRRVQYWMHDVHPGERYAAGSASYNVRPVPAHLVDHVFEVLRPGQVRGVSWFASSAMIIRDVDDLAEAEVVRKKLEACITMVVTNANEEPLGGAAISGMTGGEGDEPLTTASGEPIERLQPGMVLQGRPGWSVDFHAPPASEGLVEHMKERLHAIAAGIGTTYFQMTGDMSQASYSSMRAGELEFARLVDVWQHDLMVFQSGRPAWRRVMEAEQLHGTLPTVPRAKWTPPARPWVDPQKDAAAAIMEMEAGITSPFDIIERTGRTPEELIEELRRWRDMTADLKVGETEKEAGTHE